MNILTKLMQNRMFKQDFCHTVAIIT